MIKSMILDPDAAAYTDDEIVAKVNAASAQITRAAAVSAAARPIIADEVTGAIGTGAISSDKLAVGAAKANLDAMDDTARGYIKTAPAAGQFRIVSLERDASGKLKTDYDDTAV